VLEQLERSGAITIAGGRDGAPEQQRTKHGELLMRAIEAVEPGRRRRGRQPRLTRMTAAEQGMREDARARADDELILTALSRLHATSGSDEREPIVAELKKHPCGRLARVSAECPDPQRAVNVEFIGAHRGQGEEPRQLPDGQRVPACLQVALRRRGAPYQDRKIDRSLDGGRNIAVD
jgi:hypothetical protein